MFYVALCDDNKEFLMLEDSVVRQYMEQKNIDGKIRHFDCGEALLSQNMEEFDLILLDVEMTETGGIETARRIRQYSQIPIAFVTAHLSYSLEGYKVNAIRYILKDRESFSDAVRECLETVLHQKKDAPDRYLLEAREGDVKINIKELVYVESHRHYCYFHVQKSDGIHVYSVRGRLDEVAERFRSRDLVRIHKSYLVNLSFVDHLQRYQMKLSTGDDLCVAQPRYMDTEKAYLNYCGRMGGDRE